MKALVWNYQVLIDYHRWLAHCDLSQIILKVNATPQRTLACATSWDVVQSKLGRLS